MTDVLAEPLTDRLVPEPQSVHAHTGPPRSSVRLLMDRDVGCLFWAKLCSMMGTWSFTMVASIVVFSETGSALAVGLVGTALYLPQLLLTMPVGSRLDRGALKPLMVGGAVCMTLGGSALALWVLVIPIEGWSYAAAAMACSSLIGVGVVLSSSPMQAIVPRLVTRKELPAAMSINFAPMTLARIGGPVAGAALVAHAGVANSLVVTAVCQGIALLALLAIREPTHVPQPNGSDLSMLAAIRYVFADRQLIMILVVAVAVTFGSEPSLTLAAPLAQEFESSGILVGALSAAFGIGGLLGLFVNRLLDLAGWTRQGIALALAAMTLGMGLAAVVPWAALALMGFAIAGIGFAVAVSRTATLLILRVPSLLRGRVLSLWMLCFVGVRPIASSLTGFVTDVMSVRIAVGGMAASTLCVLLAKQCGGQPRRAGKRR